MKRVLLVVEGVAGDDSSPAGHAAERSPLVEAMRQAIAQTYPPDAVTQVAADSSTDFSVFPASDWLICPLTLNLPETLDFPDRTLYAACAEVSSLRLRVAQQGQATTDNGSFWLPMIWTAKGCLYGEVIGLADSSPPCQDSAIQENPEAIAVQQPIHFPDSLRQPLYQMGYQLLQSLAASPAVYLMQFGVSDRTIAFDRLLPFPDYPAIASLGVQAPDLFTCHWRCLTHQPIRDVVIKAPVNYREI